MATKKRTEVDIKIGNKKFVLRATYEAMSAIEDELDTPILVLLDDFGEGKVLAKVSACIVYHALQPKHSDEFEPGGKFEDTEDMTGRDVMAKTMFEMGMLEYMLPISTLIANAITGNRPATNAKGAKPGGKK